MYHTIVYLVCYIYLFFFFSSRRRHTRCLSDWSSDVCSSDLMDSKSALDGLAGAHRRQPALDMRKLSEVLSLPFGEPRPADAGHVGDRVTPGQELMICQPRVHHAI